MTFLSLPLLRLLIACPGPRWPPRDSGAASHCKSLVGCGFGIFFITEPCSLTSSRCIEVSVSGILIPKRPFSRLFHVMLLLVTFQYLYFNCILEGTEAWCTILTLAEFLKMLNYCWIKGLQFQCIVQSSEFLFCIRWLSEKETFLDSVVRDPNDTTQSR